MPMPQERRYSYADMLEWDEDVRYELYDGVPVALAAPAMIHQEIAGEIYTQLRSYLDGKKCRAYFAPVDVRLFEGADDSPEDVDIVVQPDLLVVCDPSKIDRRGVRGAPDLVVEILSDSSLRIDRLIKLGLYQRAGVKEYWIVDPDMQLVLVYALQDGTYQAAEPYNIQARVPVGVLDGCEIDLSVVFPAGK